MLHVIVLHDDDPHTPDYHFPDIGEIQKKLKKIANERMKSDIKHHQAEALDIIKVQQRGVAPAPIIIDYAQKRDIDLIIMGTHGRRGLSHLFLGSVAEEVVRFVKCPVLTIREREETIGVEALKQILVPLDFSEHAKTALVYAKNIAATYNAQLQLLHVVEDTIHPAFYATGKTSIFDFMPDVKSKSGEIMERMLEKAKGPVVKASIHVIEGRATRDVVKFAENNNSNLIIIATHGLTGIEHLFIGGVTEKVVRMARCPVFTVKSFGKSLL